MQLSRTVFVFAIMAISADAFSREKKLEDSERRTLEAAGVGGGRYLKRSLSGLVAIGSESVPAVPAPAPTPVVSGSTSTIVTGSASKPVAAPTPIASASVSAVLSGSASVPAAAPTTPALPTATLPTATLPTVVATPTATAPTATAPTVAAPTVTAPTVAAPTATAPTATSPTVAAPTVTVPPPTVAAPTAQVCRTIPIYFLKRELKTNYTRYAFGGGFDAVPYYSTDTGAQLGYYSDEATNLDSGDCVGTGVFSFGPTVSFTDQITFTFSCFGASNSITGGNGRFGCASGYEIFGADEADRISSTLYLCGVLCPYSGPIITTSPRSDVP